MSDKNAYICLTNRADDATFTPGSEVGTLPVENVTDRRLSKVYRTADITAPTLTPDTYRDTTSGRTWFEFDMGAVRVLHLAAILGHNITQDGKVRIRLSNVSDFSTLTYDSGLVDAWPTVGAPGSLPWGVFPWGGAISASEASFYSIPTYIILDEGVSGRYGRVDISDASNPDGYIQIGRLWCGPAWIPTKNIDYGWDISWEENSDTEYSRGGQAFVNVYSKRRVMRFTLSNMEENELYSNAFDFMDRRKGTSGDMIVIPQPDYPDLFINEALYCKQRTLNPIANPTYNSRERNFYFEELL